MPKSVAKGSGIWSVKTHHLSYVYVPSQEELRFHFGGLCQSPIGGRLHISFFGNGKPYVLVLEHKKLIGKTTWILYSDTANDSSVLWESEKTDVGLIHRLVLHTVNELSDFPSAEGLITTSPGKVSRAEGQKGDFVQYDLIGNLKAFLAAAPSSKKPPKIRQIISDAAELIDLHTGREALLKTVLNELGILSYPAFLCCLVKEYAAAKDGEMPLSLILFKLSVENNDGKRSIEKALMIEIIEGIKKLERNTDIVAQYDQPDSFAIILPETNIEGAKKFASRVRTAVSKISTVANSKAGNIKLIAGVTASEGLCNDIGKILGAGDEALKIAEERGPWLVTFNQLKPDSITKAKHIDTRLVQELTEQLIAKPYGIFSFPMLVAFLEHQYYRAKRSRQVSYVLLVSLVSEEAASEDVNVLRKAISLLVERLISLQNKSFLLFQYNGNTVAAMCSKGMLSLLKGYSQQIAESLCESPLADDESIKAYSLEHKLCKVGIDDDGVRRMLSITPVELS